jgi:phage baseplate assembly protein W
MTKRYLNIDPEKDYITSEADRLKQRVMRGLKRPLLSTPYMPERGTRIYEAFDSSFDVAIPKVYGDSRNFLRKYYPEINSDVIKIKEFTPDLVIDFELNVLEDNTDG